MKILETERLILRHLTLEDAPFIMELVNDPDFLLYIGDKKVRNLEDACRYLETGPLASYEKNGFGLYLVELKETGAPIGMSGLVQRPVFSEPDVGYAFLPAYRAKGYAVESARAVVNWGRDTLGQDRFLAIVTPENRSSIKVLLKIGFHFAGMVRMSPDEPEIEKYECFFSR
ncbi:MAG: GNAT family N-acetyltransferase [Blastocatellia bacterium]|nr:GNAT family N-acetyltransferase [Blastocatellia bacterium]